MYKQGAVKSNWTGTRLCYTYEDVQFLLVKWSAADTEVGDGF